LSASKKCSEINRMKTNKTIFEIRNNVNSKKSGGSPDFF
jgi:hypothetical protein